jgi:hypothetical protein
VGEKGFDHAFGSSYQQHVGCIIEKSNADKRLSLFPESKYTVGKKSEDTVDWIVCDHDSALFVECKTKRLILEAKVRLTDLAAVQSELQKMSEFILQVYKTIDDYRRNHYATLAFRKDLQIYPVIVTLEDWYLSNGESLATIKSLVEEKMIDAKLPLSYLEEMPYSVSSVEDFQTLMQVIQLHGIEEVMRGKVRNKEMVTWSFGAFLAKRFPAELKTMDYLFEQDYKALFEEVLDLVTPAS